MRGLRGFFAVPLLAAVFSACSPVYVYKSAAGEAKLLWRRKSIDKALKDPDTPEKLRHELELVRDIRAYAFDELHLRRSKDYSEYADWPGPYLTYLVTASPKLKLTPKIWSFPFAGSFPYKGHFKEKDALAEKAQLEKEGWDVYIRGVTSYNTPLPFADPVPTTVLSDPPGDLADLLIHELAHGTVYFKNHSDFDEGSATFIGDEGARQFLAKRYGPRSPELAEFEAGLEKQKAFDEAMASLRATLEEIYAGPISDEEKLRRKESAFTQAKTRFELMGYKVKTLNNAVVVAHGVYRNDTETFRRAFTAVGQDWARYVALLRSLDKKKPLEDLKSRAGVR